MSDLIDRKAAIEALRKCQTYLFDERDPDKKIELRSAEWAIGDLPSAQPEVLACGEGELSSQPEQRWIPCSERLPDDLAEVNVTWVNHNPAPYYAFTKDKPFTASAVYYEGKWYWYSSVCADVLAEYGRNDVDKVDDAIEITAWRPLPEPHRGGEKE